MNKVTNINLNGNSYQIDEAGYESLRSYLDHAARELSGNPDKDEIMADIEEAVAQKCAKFLNGHKTVVTSKEIQEIIAEMGPVRETEEKSEKAEGAAPAAGAAPAGTSPKRLYRIREGAILGGVCNGLAAYFNLDVTLVRALFIIFTLIAHGFGVLVYIVMVLLVPRAETVEEHAAAYGVPPITAKELIRRAKENYANFKSSREWRQWKHQMRDQARTWKSRLKQERYEWRQERALWRQSPNKQYCFGFFRAVREIIWLLILAFVFWYGYRHFSSVHQFFDALAYGWQQLMDAIVQTFKL